MFSVYLIQSERSEKLYIGFTSNLEKRLKEHNWGLVRSTKAYKPYRLIYKEVFKDKITARKREIQLKRKGQEREKILLKLGLLKDRWFPPPADQP